MRTLAIVVRLAQKEDFAHIERLLQQANVHASGVNERTTQFLVAENRQEHSTQLIGTVGVEWYAGKALLRSLILLNGAGNASLGIELIRILLLVVRERQAKELYLFTRDSSPFFTQLGFCEVDWQQLPNDIRTCAHAQETGRDAVPMVYTINACATGAHDLARERS